MNNRRTFLAAAITSLFAAGVVSAEPPGVYEILKINGSRRVLGYLRFRVKIHPRTPEGKQMKDAAQARCDNGEFAVWAWEGQYSIGDTFKAEPYPPYP